MKHQDTEVYFTSFLAFLFFNSLKFACNIIVLRSSTLLLQTCSDVLVLVGYYSKEVSLLFGVALYIAIRSYTYK